MSSLDFPFCGTHLTALGSGALFWAEQSLLCVSDLHLGRTERIARQGGHIIPPYENTDTLARLQQHIETLRPETVVCLGDSFDDLAAVQSLTDTESQWIARLQAGRRWIWVEGNHDPAPLDLAGTHLADFRAGPLVFRHIAKAGATAEVSGHYHPKFAVPTPGRRITRPAFVFDKSRLILPAFGTYTGGMPLGRAPLADLFQNPSVILTGQTPRLLPYSAAKGTSKPASSSAG